MGNCQSMFIKDRMLHYDELVANDPVLNLGRNKELIKRRCRGTYLGMRAIKKYPGERLKLQTGKWWRELF